MTFFEGIPDFPESFRLIGEYDVGCGLDEDADGVNTPGDSRMRTAEAESEKEFLAWAQALKDAFPDGRYSVRRDEAGVYCSVLTDGRLVYAYYVFSSGLARVIDDRSGGDPEAFTETGAAAGPCEPLLVQYGLYYDVMTPGVTCDCGMCYFIRLADGRVIMLDGGEYEQCTAPAVSDVMATLRRLTGTADGEKIRIAAWLCTHAHNDHMDLFSKLIKDHHDEIDVERVVFNFPAYAVLPHDKCVGRLKERLKRFYPDVRFLKPHTGQLLSIGGAEIRILLTHEDLIHMELPRPYGGMNGTTTVFRAEVSGAAAIFLGDLQDEGADELAERYGGATLTCAWLQAAHHCINSVENAYRSIKADKVLIPQKESDCRGRDLSHFSVITTYNDEKNCVFAGNGTDAFSFSAPAESVEHRSVVGCPYDGSEY